MRLGLVTAILEHMNFEEVIDFASAKDLDCVELACWPQEEGVRRYAGVSDIDMRDITEGKAECIKQYAKDRDVEIATLAYYPKPLESDLDKRQAVIDHLKLVIKASAMLV